MLCFARLLGRPRCQCFASKLQLAHIISDLPCHTIFLTMAQATQWQRGYEHCRIWSSRPYDHRCICALRWWATLPSSVLRCFSSGGTSATSMSQDTPGAFVRSSDVWPKPTIGQRNTESWWGMARRSLETTASCWPAQNSAWWHQAHPPSSLLPAYRERINFRTWSWYGGRWLQNPHITSWNEVLYFAPISNLQAKFKNYNCKAK